MSIDSEQIGPGDNDNQTDQNDNQTDQKANWPYSDPPCSSDENWADALANLNSQCPLEKDD